MLSIFARRSQGRKTRHKPATRSLFVQRLEDRFALSAFSVLNLNDQGAGSLRQAILSANNAGGANEIEFDVAGTIQLTSGALPAVTDALDIDGTTVPGFAGAPLVEINFNGFGGLQFNPGASGAALHSLSIVNAAGSGVTIQGGGQMLVVGNYIGLGLDGSTVGANTGDGLEMDASSGNTISSNVIGGNGGNGIGLYGSNNNQITMNSIGTDATGTLNRGNGQNGVLVTLGATGNMIGGQETGGNDPTNNVFVRPPQGNLISGNDANGVLLTGQATQNTLSGNFIGTAASGNSALGNSLDGVAIVSANGNSLIGCTFQDDPFVFYNVISGNGGNGVRITNSNNTTIQANFLGVGANNQTAVGNALNGVLVEGSSTDTTMGGPIPLGNVDAANGENGILVRDTASFFTTYNTFCGLAAFETYTNLGNHGDGMLITSTGGNILIRTNVITENGNDGIEISGAASGVRVAGNIVGLDTGGNLAMGNKNNGVEVDGNATDDIIGGPQPTFNVIPQNAISANGGNGVAIDGNAHDITISHSYIGTDLTGRHVGTNGTGQAAFGNADAGVYLGPGTYGDTIGSTDASLLTIISGNAGDGIQMNGTQGNTVIGTYIGTDATGSLQLGNSGNGISITNSSGNVIGGVSSGGGTNSSADLIAFNGANGVLVASGNHNGIRGNSIHANGLLGIDLASGANMNQAAPVLTSVSTLGQGVQVAGSLTSTPSTTFTVELFANYLNEPSGNIDLGSVTVTTNAAGFAVFSFQGAAPPVAAGYLTATATDLANDTSEFSAVTPAAPWAPAMTLNGTTLDVSGSGTFAVSFSSPTAFTVSIGNLSESYTTSQVNAIDFTGGPGQTTATVSGNLGTAYAQLLPDAGTVSGATYTISLATTPTISISDSAGSGNSLSANLKGPTSGSNTFVTTSTYSQYSGVGFSNLVSGASVVEGDSQAGASDTAFIYSAPGDVLVTTPTYAYLTGLLTGGDGQFRSTTAFATTYGSSAGGDSAWQYGGSGNDVLTTTPTYSSMTSTVGGNSVVNQVAGFPVVYGYGIGSGETAYMYGGSDMFAYVATSSYAYVSGTGYFDEAVGFGQTYGISSGTGIAYLYDSAGNDTLIGTSTYTNLSGTGFFNQAQGFALVQAFSTAGGTDTAWLYDAPGSNAFVGSGEDADLSSSAAVLDTEGFANVNAVQTQGTNDTKHVGAIDYALTFNGSWTSV